jgi:hypothetical protein
MEDETNVIKVAVLEQKVFDLKEIVLKLEEAIERINDVNSNITKMLAVHDERINMNEQNNHTLYEKVWELSRKIDSNKIDIEKKVDEVSKEATATKNKIVTITAIILFFGFIISNSSFFGRLLHQTPQPRTSLTNTGLCARIV